ncbi:mCG1027767, partial [Mus musculus]
EARINRIQSGHSHPCITAHQNPAISPHFEGLNCLWEFLK